MDISDEMTRNEFILMWNNREVQALSKEVAEKVSEMLENSIKVNRVWGISAAYRPKPIRGRNECF